MSIQSEIDRINNAKAGIAEAISEKGVIVAEGTSIDDMAALVRSIPQEGGSSMEEIVYVDCVLNFATLSVESISATYEEITAMIEAGKYVIVRGAYALVAAPTNVLYIPISTWTKEQNLVSFNGMLQADINGTVAILHLTLMLFSDNHLASRVRLVSTTDLN